MIRYALICSQHHEFDAWFKNSEGFDLQAKAGEVSCPVCADADIRKALMAPAIGRKSDAGPGREPPERAKEEGRQAASLSSAAREKLSALRKEIEQTHDYVGERFTEEARKMHFGEVEHRGIYGEATKDQAQELASEGINVTPLPFTIRLDA